MGHLLRKVILHKRKLKFFINALKPNNIIMTADILLIFSSPLSVIPLPIFADTFEMIAHHKHDPINIPNEMKLALK